MASAWAINVCQRTHRPTVRLLTTTTAISSASLHVYAQRLRHHRHRAVHRVSYDRPSDRFKMTCNAYRQNWAWVLVSGVR